MEIIKMKQGLSNLQVFADTLLELARTDSNLVVVTSDSRGSGKLNSFAKELPEQLVEVGIAEQNLVGVSAGLAAMGKNVFAVSPASFLTARSLEQIKNDVAYSDHPVKLIGISAGVSYGALGATHHSLHDYAVLQAINNLDIAAPADNLETQQIIRAAAHHPKPLYIRFGKRPMPVMPDGNTPIEIGKAHRLTPDCDQPDVAMIAIGEAVPIAYQAHLQLQQKGINSCVLSMHSLRPFDEAVVMKAVLAAKTVITIEEHSLHGGLGSRVAALLMQAGIFRPMKIVGFPDVHMVSGSQTELFDTYGITPNSLEQAACQLLRVVKETN